jgi:hypothetical protein
LAARKRKQDEEEAARRQEEEAVVSALCVKLRALRDTDPGMSLLTAVEFTTSDPEHRVALYRCCTEDGDIRVHSLSQDEPRLLKIASSSALYLAFPERRARGRRVSSPRMKRNSALEGSRTVRATARSPSPTRCALMRASLYAPAANMCSDSLVRWTSRLYLAGGSYCQFLEPG